MSTSSAPSVSTSPEFFGTLRNRLESLPNKEIAIDTDIDESHLGKVLAGKAALKLSDVGKLVKKANLKLVDASRVCVRKDEIAFLRHLYAVVTDHAPHLLNEVDQ